jgi:hypothetical protein
MEIKTKFNKWDETFVIIHWDIFSFFITGIRIEDDEEWITIDYHGKVEMPFGKVTSQFVEWTIPGDELYSTFKIAKKELDKKETSDEADKKEVINEFTSFLEWLLK